MFENMRRVIPPAMLASMILTIAAVFAIPGGSGTAIAAAKVLGPSGTQITVEVSEGRLIRLDRPAATVFIADQQVADVQIKTPRLIYIFGKAFGDTTLYAVDAQDRVLINRTVHVRPNLSRLRWNLKNLLPKEAITVRAVQDTIVLSGTVSNASAAADARRLAATVVRGDNKVISQLGVSAPQQVNLRVRVAEVSRDTVKQLGINWDVVAATGNFVLGLATGLPTTAAGIPFFPLLKNNNGGLATTGNTLVTRNVAGANTTNSIVGNFNNGVVDVNGVLDALDQRGLIKILAEPNLSAMSGETANFLAGGEFPVPVPQDGGVITIEFKKFGVGLAFTPTVLDGNRINLKVAPEVSQLSTVGAVTIQNFTIPALTVRRAETTVELASGQSFAIAGLIQNNTNNTIRNLPWLGEIPVIGALFRSEAFQRNETELIILVTPYIVKPISKRSIVEARAQTVALGAKPAAVAGAAPNAATGAAPRAAPGAAPGGAGAIKPAGSMTGTQMQAQPGANTTGAKPPASNPPAAGRPPRAVTGAGFALE